MRWLSMRWRPALLMASPSKLATCPLGVLEVKPRVGLTVQCKLQLLPQALRPSCVVQDALFHVVQAHAET
jgi:hypothetical protein